MRHPGLLRPGELVDQPAIESWPPAFIGTVVDITRGLASTVDITELTT